MVRGGASFDRVVLIRSGACNAGDKLESQFDEWRTQIEAQHQFGGEGGRIRAIIVPHAGHRYSGRVALQAYLALSRQTVKRMILIGPSHRTQLPMACEFSSFSSFETPLGPLQAARCPSIVASRAFGPLAESVDCKEHSLEVQFPLIKYLFPKVQILPILVSAGLGASPDARYAGKELAKALEHDEGGETVLVVSSDFCHWGDNYFYKPDLSSEPGDTISARIRALDQGALNCIASQDVAAFRRYLLATGNTICGRDAITLAMEALHRLGGGEGRWHWLAYEQSGDIGVHSSRESSVSYVAGVFVDAQ